MAKHTVQDADVQQFRWFWVSIFWGNDLQITELLPGRPHYDQFGRIDYWETCSGKAWIPGKDATGHCWYVADVLELIPDPRGT